MGGRQSTAVQAWICNVAVSPPDAQGSTPIYRSVTSPKELVHNLDDNSVKTCGDFFLESVRKFGTLPFLGERKKLDIDKFGNYMWMTYNEALQHVRKIGTFLQRNQLVDSHLFVENGREIRSVGIFAKNCPEWFIMEQVCNLFGYTLCPLYDTLGWTSLRHILRQTHMSILCVDDIENFVDILQEFETGNLRTLLILRDDQRVNADLIQMLRKKNLDVHYLHDIINSFSGTFEDMRPDADSVHTICYTSGTGGLPKGCIIEQRQAVAVVSTALRFIVNSDGPCPFRKNDKFLSFLPLAHVYERCVCNVIIGSGNAIGVYSGDVKRLLEDIQYLKPAVLFAVPRVVNKIVDKIMLAVLNKSFLAQNLFQRGLEAKIEQKHATCNLKHGFWDVAVFDKARRILNPELRMIVSGGAPLHPVVADRAGCCLCIPIVQGYGLTETFGPCFLSCANDPDSRDVGGIWPCLEFKLISIPELGHFVSEQHPRGEICLRGPGVIKEYLCRVIVEDCWDENGWYHTGDIGVLLPNKALQIIGRKRQMFKLSQGEYILPEKIENIYIQSTFIEQIFVTGNPFNSHPVALIVPDLEAATQWGARNGLDLRTREEFCVLPAFKEAVVQDMAIIGAQNNLNGFEKPSKCSLIAEPFTPWKQQLTPTLKMIRRKIEEDYKDIISKMYDTIL